jgi:hypothetical protein
MDRLVYAEGLIADEEITGRKIELPAMLPFVNI